MIYDEYNTIIIGIIVVIIIIIIYEIAIHIYIIEIDKTYDPPIGFNNKIPNIIHRTWYSRSLSKKMHDLAYYSWIKLNPKYKMIWNNDKDCEEFMKNFGDKEYIAWKRIIPTAYKADLWRLCTLYKYGGVYVDSYAVAVKSIDDTILLAGLNDEKDIFISVLDCEQAGGYIHNGYIICTPMHPIIKQCIEDILVNVDTGKEDKVMSLTGPICLGRSMNKYLGREIDTKHQLGLNDVNNKKYYLLKFNFGLPGYITIDDEVMLYKKYDIIDCWLYQKIYKGLIYSKQSYSCMNNLCTVVSDYDSVII